MFIYSYHIKPISYVPNQIKKHLKLQKNKNKNEVKFLFLG